MKPDVLIIGAGVAGLTAGALLTARGKRVCVLEQNWMPGGCASSYPRKHFVFESGATTLVGLDEGMPLAWLLRETGIQIEAERLDIPMQVHLADGEVLTRYEDLEEWIGEAERVFGPQGQRGFWEECYANSSYVWRSSVQQRAFPPTNLRDLWWTARHFRWGQLKGLPAAFRSTLGLMKKHGLADDPRFRAFVDEQLMISAQNTAEEVNVLFGSAALCYTNYGNYYVPGGMINLVNPLVRYIEEGGGEVLLRKEISAVTCWDKGYRVQSRKGEEWEAGLLLSALPLNNTLPLFNGQLKGRLEQKVMPSAMLRSAFQMGIAFRRHRDFEVVHHQIHLENPLPGIASPSIFLSLSHGSDLERCGEGEAVASISTHIDDPATNWVENKEVLENAVLDVLEAKGFLRRENILYQHSSTPGSWEKWTGRKWGFVGGYPQYMRIKPWQMKDARLDGKGAYICGDSTYPGQGIPGACLSGLVAVEKMALDHF